MASGKKIRVLIADGRPVFRMGLRLLLAEQPDITVVGEVDNTDQVLKKVSALKPQVVLIHSRLGEKNGHSALQQLRRNHPKARVFVLVSSDKEEEHVRALRLPTTQIVPKQTPFRQLVQWIRQMEQAGSRLAPSVPGSVTEMASGSAQFGGEVKKSSPLSSRERQVVELVSQGFKNREIAQRMFISERTVKNHLHSIIDKLGVSDSLELVLYITYKNLQGSH